jgi:hypothetical protein
MKRMFLLLIMLWVSANLMAGDGSESPVTLDELLRFISTSYLPENSPVIARPKGVRPRPGALFSRVESSPDRKDLTIDDLLGQIDFKEDGLSFEERSAAKPDAADVVMQLLEKLERSKSISGTNKKNACWTSYRVSKK